MRVLFASIVGVILWCIVIAQAAEQSVTLGGLNVAVWSQETKQNVKQPIIIFSHGFHGCATQSRFLMEAFAGAGYIVFAPNHRDATCNGGAARLRDKPEVSFREIEHWNDASFRDRADDIRRLIGAIQSDPRFRDRADWSRFGLAGHSLGGYTVLALGGAWPSWRQFGVKAILALSPYSQPFTQQHTLGGLSAPVMYQGGTRDLGITPTIHKTMGSYDQSPSPKYYVEFDGAGHFAWTNIGRAAHQQIVAYSLAFMNHYVKGSPADPALTQALPGVAEFSYDSELGNSGKR